MGLAGKPIRFVDPRGGTALPSKSDSFTGNAITDLFKRLSFLPTLDSSSIGIDLTILPMLRMKTPSTNPLFQSDGIIENMRHLLTKDTKPFPTMLASDGQSGLTVAEKIHFERKIEDFLTKATKGESVEIALNSIVTLRYDPNKTVIRGEQVLPAFELEFHMNAPNHGVSPYANLQEVGHWFYKVMEVYAILRQNYLKRIETERRIEQFLPIEARHINRNFKIVVFYPDEQTQRSLMEWVENKLDQIDTGLETFYTTWSNKLITLAEYETATEPLFTEIQDLSNLFNEIESMTANAVQFSEDMLRLVRRFHDFKNVPGQVVFFLDNMWQLKLQEVPDTGQILHSMEYLRPPHDIEHLMTGLYALNPKEMEKKNGVKLEIHIDLPPEIVTMRLSKAARKLLIRALTNPVTNGLKFGATTVIVTVELGGIDRQGQRYLAFTIEDNGCGMNADTLLKYSKERNRAPGVEAIPGTGLGAWSFRNSLGMLGGFIGWLSSGIGVGTKIRFEIPIPRLKSE